MRSQVGQARDAAVEVMNKSERYTNMVEPELTHLNQKWEEIMQKLKVSFIPFRGCLCKMMWWYNTNKNNSNNFISSG